MRSSRKYFIPPPRREFQIGPPPLWIFDFWGSSSTCSPPTLWKIQRLVYHPSYGVRQMQTADLQTCTSLSITSTSISQTSTTVSQKSTSVRLFTLAISDGNGKSVALSETEMLKLMRQKCKQRFSYSENLFITHNVFKLVKLWKAVELIDSKPELTIFLQKKVQTFDNAMNPRSKGDHLKALNNIPMES